jgi:competence protein ComEC
MCREDMMVRQLSRATDLFDDPRRSIAAIAMAAALGAGALVGCGDQTTPTSSQPSAPDESAPHSTLTTSVEAPTPVTGTTSQEPADTTGTTIGTPSTVTTEAMSAPKVQVASLEIVSVDNNAPGDDNANLNEEYITFRILESGSLAGFAVEDESGSHYDFPDRRFSAGQLLTLHTGSGTDSQTHLYWGSTREVWNNGSDTIKVFDPRGQTVIEHLYYSPAGGD